MLRRNYPRTSDRISSKREMVRKNSREKEEHEKRDWSSRNSHSLLTLEPISVKGEIWCRESQNCQTNIRRKNICESKSYKKMTRKQKPKAKSQKQSKGAYLIYTIIWYYDMIICGWSIWSCAWLGLWWCSFWFFKSGLVLLLFSPV